MIVPALVAPHRLDLDARWLAAALKSVARHALLEPAAWQARLEGSWSPDGDGLACLSVRSAFDLLLACAGWQPGDAVVFTALNIDDMPRLVEAHGFEVRVVDVAPDTLAPDPDALARALDGRVRALVVCHPFGGDVPLDALAAVAHARDVLVIEDAAQTFRGPQHRGHPDADVALFSFGTLKTATALGGALVRVRDAALRARMAALQARWPVQPAGAYLRKVLRAGVLLAGHSARAYGCAARALAALGVELGDVVRTMTRGFAQTATDSWLAGLRQRPGAPLLALLAERLAAFDPGALARRAASAESVLSRLPPAARVGTGLRDPTWWLAPVQVRDPAGFRARLRSQGFDTSAASNIAAVGAAPRARALLERLVFLPAAAQHPPELLRRLGDSALGALADGC